MKKAKAAGNSNANSRFFGASIGVITALPIALSATVLSTVVSPTNGFTKFTSDITAGLTGNQAKNADEEMKEVVKLADAMQNVGDQEVIDALAAAFGDASKVGASPLSPTDSTFKTLKSILDSKIVARSMPTIMDMFDIDKTKVDFTVTPKPLFTVPVVTDPAQKSRLLKAVQTQFSTSNPDNIKTFLEALKVF